MPGTCGPTGKGLISRELMTSACLLLSAASAGQLVTQVTELGPGSADAQW